MVQGFENDEVVDGVGLDDEIIGRLQTHGGPEVAKAEGDRPAEINVTRVPEQAHPGVGPVLDQRRSFALGLVVTHFRFENSADNHWIFELKLLRCRVGCEHLLYCWLSMCSRLSDVVNQARLPLPRRCVRRPLLGLYHFTSSTLSSHVTTDSFSILIASSFLFINSH